MCPFAQKAWLAIEACHIPYELREIPLYGPNGKPNWFLELNPEGTVPVLSCQNGDVIPDSELILDYIGEGSLEGSPSTLCLDGTNKELEIQSWRSDISKRVIPIGKRAVLGGSKIDLFELLKELDSKIEGPYLCGETLTLADCAAFPFLWRLDQEFGPLSEMEHDCGSIRSWLDHCMEQTCFRKTVKNAWWWWW